MRYTFSIGILLLLSVHLSSLIAQEADPFPRTIKIENLEKLPLGQPQNQVRDLYPTTFLDRNNNLPSDQIQDLAMDSLGRLWFTTATSGFGFIDHKHVYIFSRANRFQDRVDEVFVASNGDVWLGGNGVGVYHVQGGEATWYITPETPSDSASSLSDVHIQDIKEDSQGNIWISTRLGGMTMYDGERFHHHGPEQGFPCEIVHSFAIDARDRVWCMVNDGIIIIDDGKYSRYNQTFPPGKPSPSNLISHDGQIIAACYWGDVLLLEDSGVSSYHPVLSASLSKEHHCSAYEFDEQGRLWLHQNGVLMYWDGHQLVPVSDMTKDRSRVLYQSIFREGKLWTATSKGIYCTADFHIRRIDEYWVHRTTSGFLAAQPKPEFLPDVRPYIRPLSVDTKGILKMGDPFHGLAKGQVEHYGYYSLPNGYALYYQDRESDKLHFSVADTIGTPLPHISARLDQFIGHWVDNTTGYYYGSLNDKIAWVDDDSIKVSQASTPGHADRPCYNNLGGYLFRTTNDQVGYFFKNNTLTCLRDIPALKDFASISSWIQMPDGSQIASSRGMGLRRISEDGSFQQLDRGMSTPYINYGHLDDLGQAWFETFDGGVIFYNGGQPISFTKKDGLSHNYLYFLHEDDQGNIWLGTGRGATVLKLVDPTMEVSTKDDLLSKYEVISFTKENGLTDAMVDNIFHDQAGNVWMHSSGTWFVVNLESMQRSRITPGIILTGIQVMGKSILDSAWASSEAVLADDLTGLFSIPRHMELDHTINQIQFDFATSDWTEGALLQYKLVGLDEDWNEPSDRFELSFTNLPPGQYTLMAVVIDSQGNRSEVMKYPFVINPPFWETWWFYSCLVGLGIVLIALFIHLRTRAMQRKQRILKKMVETRTFEIQNKNVQLESKNREILDSINYARRLQEAILPSPRLVKEYLFESFILYKPKDIVAGDFYWVEPLDGKVYFAAADCTGHGVPGAMVSVVCANALNRAVMELGLRDPGEILDRVTDLVVDTFEKSDEVVKDGMDIALCSLDTETLELRYAGANNPLWLFTSAENADPDESMPVMVESMTATVFKEIKANKQPVGSYAQRESFTSHTIQLNKGDSVYLFTDGFADQFGGDLNEHPLGKKFKYKPFKEMLSTLQDTPMNEQMQVINRIFEDWKGDLEQVDDVCVIGVRV